MEQSIAAAFDLLVAAYWLRLGLSVVFFCVVLDLDSRFVVCARVALSRAWACLGLGLGRVPCLVASCRLVVFEFFFMKYLTSPSC